ncbi:fumarylacetoacetate hydrolase family protein [Nocardioides sp. NPDC006303]|uniref:fumarylacetoacetate hydrolase family protein n=1 Tax=Nocardioides sp. NPDC006303 TaxID=3156747 RepID=UPI0033AFB9CE
MRIVVYGDQRRLGAIQDHRILDLGKAADSDPACRGVFASLLTLIESGERGLDMVGELLERFEGSDRPDLHVELENAHLHAPFPGRRLAFAGSNNPDHVAAALVNHGQDVTAAEIRERTRRGPAGGFWVVSPPVGPGSEVTVPRGSDGYFDYEGEVAIVLARGGKRIAAEDWRDHVWGTTLVIDWSVRGRTLAESKRPFYAHKIFDGSTSLGPWISVGEVDPLDCSVETRVNGDLRQKFNSGDMIHTYGELLEQMSEDLTLLPGDLLGGGTGAGTAVDSTRPAADGTLPLDRFLKPGDRVEVSAARLGTLMARVVGDQLS